MTNALIDEAKQVLIDGENNKAETLFHRVKDNAASYAVAFGAKVNLDSKLHFTVT
ncbi:MAG: hypothetical protein V3T17_19360 [Pseudomonadales bacterium]